MSQCGVTDEWVEERGRGKHYCNTGLDGERPVHTHTRTPTYTHTHLNLGACKHTRRVALTQTHTTHGLCLRADLIMVTPISKRWQQHGGGCGRLWMPGEMSSQSTDTHPVATSIPISGACQSTRRTHNGVTPPPLCHCRAAVSAKQMSKADQYSSLPLIRY